MMDSMGFLAGRQAHLDQQGIFVPKEADVDPLCVPRAAGLKIASEYDSGNTQPKRAEFTFEIGLDAADNHVGNFGHRVEHIFIDGRSLSHEHCRTDTAGHCR